MTSILIIDDEDKLRLLLKRIIALEGYKVYDVATIKNARHFLETHQIEIIICDVKLPDGNGINFIKEIADNYPHTITILLTAYGNIPDSVQAIKNGAFDYIVKGDDNDKIIPLLSKAVDTIKQQQQIKRIESQNETIAGFDAVIGTSPSIVSAIQLAKKVAPTDTSVLLTGETGTGKEVFAQAIHHNSQRAKNMFVALNCSAFSKEILESELFGHKAGSFTGATKDKTGLVEEANGGTLFLDELGEMSLELQPKLLRLLENGTYLRVGDTKEHKTNIRIIAATNKSLQNEIEAGHFRSDLYYRIAVFTIELPSVRERVNDIPALAAHFLAIYTEKSGKNIDGFTRDAMGALLRNDWKGNVRELKNVIERAVILEDENILGLSSLSFGLQQTDKNSLTFDLSTVEKLHIQKVLKYTNGNKAEASRLLNIGLATLYRKIDEYHLK